MAGSHLDWQQGFKITGDLNTGALAESQGPESASFRSIAIEYVDPNGGRIHSALLSDEAVGAANQYLRRRLEICFRELQVSKANSHEYLDARLALVRYVAATKDKLKLSEIDAPDGRRAISEKEAGEIIRHIGIASHEVCELE